MGHADKFPNPLAGIRWDPSGRRALMATALLLFMCTGGGEGMRSARAEEYLNGGQVQNLIVGNTLQGSYLANQLTMVWYAKGVVLGAMGLQGSDDGTWEIEGDQYCHEWTTYFGGVRHCYRWRSQGDHYVLVNEDAFRTYNIQGRIEKGMPPGY